MGGKKSVVSPKTIMFIKRRVMMEILKTQSNSPIIHSWQEIVHLADTVIKRKKQLPINDELPHEEDPIRTRREMNLSDDMMEQTWKQTKYQTWLWFLNATHY